MNKEPLFTEGFQNWIDTYNRSKILQKVGYHLIVVAFFFCYAFSRKGGDFFDHRRIYQVKRKVQVDAVRNDLHGDYGIDK